MNKLIAITLCSLPIALASTGYAQGTSGRSGSGAAGAAQQSESTSPSGLAGSTGAKREPSTGKSPAASNDGPAQPATQTDKKSEGAAASNRSSSGSSTNTTVNQAPGETGKSAPASKSSMPSAK